jgi:hypothetical protein
MSKLFLVPAFVQVTADNEDAATERFAKLQSLASAARFSVLQDESIPVREVGPANAKVELHSILDVVPLALLAQQYGPSGKTEVNGLELDSEKISARALTLTQFCAQRRFTESIGDALGLDDLRERAGYIYPADCYIEKSGESWYLCVTNWDKVSNDLHELERILYNSWYVGQA